MWRSAGGRLPYYGPDQIVVYVQSRNVGVDWVRIGYVGRVGKEAGSFSSRLCKIFINSLYCKLHIKFCDPGVTESASTLCVLEFVKGTAYHIGLEFTDKPTGAGRSKTQEGNYDSHLRDSPRIYYTWISTVGYGLFRG